MLASSLLIAFNFLFGFFYLIILLQVFLPWFPRLKNYRLVNWLLLPAKAGLMFLRKALPPNYFRVDVAPFVLIVLLFVVHRMVLYILPR